MTNVLDLGRDVCRIGGRHVEREAARGLLDDSAIHVVRHAQGERIESDCPEPSSYVARWAWVPQSRFPDER